MPKNVLHTSQLVCLLVAGLALPSVLWAVAAIRSNTTDMSQWLPENRDVKIRYDQFVERFGIDDFVLISWPGCKFGDPRIERLQHCLSNRTQDSTWPLDRELPFAEVLQGPEIIQEVVQSARTKQATAIDRLRGVFVGPSQHTCILAALSPAGLGHPADVVRFIRNSAARVGVNASELRMGGSVCQVTAIDTESMASMQRLAPLSGLVAFVVAVFCLRDLRLTIIAMSIAGYTAGASLALIYYSGFGLNGVMTVLPTLAFVLTLSGAIHLLNYYRDALPDNATSDDQVDEAITHSNAVDQAMLVGWMPCAIALVTTSLSMASLSTSGLRPVREFGSFAAASLLLALAILLTVLPASLRLFAGTYPRSQLQKRSNWHAAFGRVAGLVVTRHKLITLLSFATLILVGSGLLSIRSSVSLDRMFRPGFRLLEDYGWLEREVGALSTVEVVIKFAGGEATPPVAKQAEFVSAVHQTCANVEGIVGVFSAATFMPGVPKSGGLRNKARRSLFQKLVADSFDEFEQKSLAAIEEGNRLWRVCARVPATQTPDFDQLIQQLRASIESLPAPRSHTPGSTSRGFSVEFTGSYPVIYDSQHILLKDLAVSFGLAFLLILPVMVVALKSLSGGLLAMVPNVAPIVIVFGAMGWLDIPVDIGIVLTASVALGIAVDDTIHFLTWYKRSMAVGSDAAEATRTAFVRCAPAMVQTTIICGLGVLMFAASMFAPAGRFAILLSLLLVSALVGDLLMLPALLLTRARKPRTEQSQPKLAQGVV